METYRPSTLPEADRIEVVDLSGLSPRFVSGYMAESSNAPVIVVTGEQTAAICALWRLLPEQPDMMRCHIPPYGLRFFFQDLLLLEGSVCWRCDNIYLTTGNKEYCYKFDGASEPAQALYALIADMLPREHQVAL